MGIRTPFSARVVGREVCWERLQEGIGSKLGSPAKEESASLQSRELIFRIRLEYRTFLEVDMFAETSAEFYPGVLCSRCMEPIPVPPRVVSLQNEIENRATNVQFGFTLRCRLCEHESVYLTSEIQKFDGEPRARILKSRAAGA